MNKTVFLTSSPTGDLDGRYRVEGFDDRNDFRENLRAVWPERARCLMITASPDACEQNDEMTAFFEGAVLKSGLTLECMDLWDRRTEDFSSECLRSYQVIFLGGGHVPTQNAFFTEIHLREKIQAFEGVIIGISAGTMNSADVVYAQPELPGESIDPDYRKFLSGLNLTKTMILPHYQMVKGNMLDGRRLYEDITYGDSKGREFLAIPDGSYVMIQNGKETIYGEAYYIRDGRRSRAGVGSFEDFRKIIARLRAQDGCPWDREQTHGSLKAACIEEAAEVICGINVLESTGNADNLKEELGDLLLQVMLHAQIAEEEGVFTIEDVIQGISDKMIRRHPHVFGGMEMSGAGEVMTNWTEIKKQEKAGKEWVEEYLPGAFNEAEELIAVAKKRKG
ncbi:MAG: MazG nucleotide pyrophosphohydrolase domain-containing protein, partial [Coprococcus sp.]